MLRRLRADPTFASSLYAICRPIYAVAKSIENLITRSVKRSGGSATYDGIALNFPPNVGPEFLSLISWHGTQGFEPNTWRTLRALIEKSGTFIDVGANIGFYSVLAKKVRPEIDVISFEPIPNICNQNRAFHSANGIAPSVRQVALSNKNGVATIYQPLQSDSGETSASTLATDSWQARKGHTAITVETITLDSFLGSAKLRCPITMKIDVEDFEYAVLRGAAETIRQYRPQIVCEILPALAASTTELATNTSRPASNIVTRKLFLFLPT